MAVDSLKSVPVVDGAQAMQLVQTGAFLLDVREVDEWTAARASDSTLMPLGQLPRTLQSLPRDRIIVVVCRSGNRSATATQLLNKQGFQAVNLIGGLPAWAAAGGEVVNTSGLRVSI